MKSCQLELQNHGFRNEGIVKTMFSQKLFGDDSGLEFECFSDALGTVFMTSHALETGLKIECFV